MTWGQGLARGIGAVLVGAIVYVLLSALGDMGRPVSLIGGGCAAVLVALFGARVLRWVFDLLDFWT